MHSSSGSSSSSPNADSTYGQAARSAAYSTDDIEAGTLVSTDTATAAVAASSNNSSSGRTNSRHSNAHSSAIDGDEALLSEEKNRASRAVGIVRLVRLTQVKQNCLFLMLSSSEAESRLSVLQLRCPEVAALLHQDKDPVSTLLQSMLYCLCSLEQHSFALFAHTPQRQKAARRRKLWQRSVDAQGLCCWVRVPHTGESLQPTVAETVTQTKGTAVTDTTATAATGAAGGTAGAAAAAIADENTVIEQLEAGLAVADVTVTTQIVDSASGQQPSAVLDTDTTASTAEHSSSSSSRSSEQQQQQQLQLQLSPNRAAAVRHYRDVYGDDTMLSLSPGFVSTFKESGRMGWHQVTNGVQVHTVI
jgi:hypothetical protein